MNIKIYPEMNIGHLVQVLFLDHTRDLKFIFIRPSSSSPPLNSQNDTQVANNYNSLLFLYVYNRKSLDEERHRDREREREGGGGRERRKHGTRCYHFTLSIID